MLVASLLPPEGSEMVRLVFVAEGEHEAAELKFWMTHENSALVGGERVRFYDVESNTLGGFGPGTGMADDPATVISLIRRQMCRRPLRPAQVLGLATAVGRFIEASSMEQAS